MDKDATTTPAPRAADYVRFLCESAVTSPQNEYSRQFGRGAIVDLSEEIWPGRFLADEVRPGTFERVESAITREFEAVDNSHDDEE